MGVFSLRAKIIGFSLAAILLICATFLWSLWRLEEQSIDQTLENNLIFFAQIWKEEMDVHEAALAHTTDILRQNKTLIQSIREADVDVIRERFDNVWAQRPDNVDLIFFWNAERKGSRIIDWIGAAPPENRDVYAPKHLETVTKSKRAATGLEWTAPGELMLLRATPFFNGPGRAYNLGVVGINAVGLLKELEGNKLLNSVAVLNSREHFQSPIHVDERTREAVYHIPLHDVTGTVIGTLELRQDLTPVIGEFERVRIITIGVPVIVSLLIVSVVVAFIRVMLHRIGGFQMSLAAAADWAPGSFDIDDLNIPNDELGQIERRFIQQGLDLAKNQSELRLSGIVFENALEAIIITDAEARIIDVNPAYERITGFSKADVMGKHPCMPHGNLDDGHLFRHENFRDMLSSIMRKGSWEGEIVDRRADGEVFAMLFTISAIKDAFDNTTNMVGVFTDITERKVTEERIHKLAFFDALTELPNRSLFREQLEHHFSLARRQGKKLALLFIDLDRFKHVNDTLGHPMGDQLLIEVSERLKSRVRSSDIVSRLSGDEFTIILTNLDETAVVSQIAHKIIRAVSKPVLLAGHEVHVGASVGISLFPNDATDFDALLKHADTAMYKAKEMGRGNYKFFTEDMDREGLERMELERNLRRAIENKEFRLHYQPKVNIQDDAVPGMEALVRWIHPEHGMISPVKFIPLAEETGLIVPLGRWVLESACRQAAEWKNQGYGPFLMGVNISAQQFEDEGMVDFIRELMDETGLPPDYLDIEITESMVMKNVNAAMKTLEKLASLGIQISVDDFGTGYSSLSYLRRFPAQVVKIDQSFIRNVIRNHDDAQIVAAIISMAHNLGMKVVAEGVETQEHVVFLREMKCDEVQGYYFGRPCPAEEFDHFFHEVPGVEAAARAEEAEQAKAAAG